MAARRLIIVLVVLLGISIAAASIAPDRQRLAALPETDSTAPIEDAPLSSGGLVSAEIQASVEKPRTVRATVGDRLTLTVTSERAVQVEIPPLGLFGDAGGAAPARFDLLLRQPGALPITDASNGRVIGRIVVAEEEPPGSGSGHGRSPGGGQGEGIEPAQVEQA